MKKKFLLIMSLMLVFVLAMPIIAHSGTYEVDDDIIVHVTITNPVTSIEVAPNLDTNYHSFEHSDIPRGRANSLLCEHLFAVVDASTSPFSGGTHTVLMQISYWNPVTDWGHTREEHRTCHITFYVTVFDLQCTLCGIPTSSASVAVSHTYC